MTRSNVKRMVGLASLVGLSVLMVSRSQASGAAVATSLAPTHVKADSARVSVFLLGLTGPAGETLTDFDLRVTGTTGFSDGDLRADVNAAGCTEAVSDPLNGDGQCDGVSLWRDDGTVADQLDAGDHAVSASYTKTTVGDCAVGPCDFDLTFINSNAAFPVPAAAEGTGTFIVVLRTSSTITNGDQFTASLQAGAMTTSPAPTVCCSGTATTGTITADTIAPTSPVVSATGLSRGAGAVHVGTTDISGEASAAIVQVYSSTSDLCSSAALVAESSSQDLTSVNRLDVAGFDAAALKAFPAGQFVCYRIKDRALNLSGFVSDGTMPGSASAGQVGLLGTSNVTGAKRVDGIVGAAATFRLYLKPGNAGDFVRTRNEDSLNHDEFIDITTSSGAATCSLKPPSTTVCTTDIARYQNTNSAGPTLADADGIGYSLVSAEGNDGSVTADGIVPPAAVPGDLTSLQVSAANGHQRLIHKGGTAGSVFGLYFDADGIGPGGFDRAVDNVTGQFVTVTSAVGSTASNTTDIRTITAGTALGAADNIAYVATNTEQNVSSMISEGAIPAAPAAADLSVSDALNQLTWAPAVFPANTNTLLFTGATASDAYGANGTPVATANQTTPTVTVAPEQPSGVGVFFTSVTTDNGHESPTIQDGTIPAPPVTGDLGILGTSAVAGHQRISAAIDAAAVRTFGLFVDTTGTGSSFQRAVTSSAGSTPVEVTTSATVATTSSGTPGAQSIFAGATALAASHRVGYAFRDGASGNTSDVTEDSTIPQPPVAANGFVSDAGNTFTYTTASAALKARLHAAGYQQAGPDGEAASSAPVDIADPTDGSTIAYTIYSAQGNESVLVADGSLPTISGSVSTILSVSAADFNQRLVATQDANQPRIFRLFLDPPNDSETRWRQAVTSSGGTTPVELTTAATSVSTNTITIYVGTAQLGTAWQVAYAQASTEGHDSEVEAEGEIPDPVLVQDVLAKASTDQVTGTVPANRSYRLYASTSSDANTAYDQGIDATLTNAGPTQSVNLSSGDNTFYSSLATISGHESALTTDGAIPQAINAANTGASDALDQFTVTGASAAQPVKILIDASSDPLTAYGAPDYTQTATASPHNPGADIPTGFLYYYVLNSGASTVSGAGNESPITSVDSVPAAPDVAALMSASAALQSITASSDSNPGRILRLYVDADGGGAGTFVRPTTLANGSQPVQLTTASSDVTSASGIFTGATPLSAGALVGYSRVVGPNGQNDSDITADGAIPAPPVDNFTADAAMNNATIAAAAPTGTYRVFKQGTTPISVKRSHTTATATVVAFSSPNAIAAGNSIGYATSNAEGNESMIFADGIIPNVSAPDLQIASDTGVSGSDNITSDTTPTFDVTTDPNASVELFEGGTSYGTATANGTGLATKTTPVLTEAAHPITAKATQNGNTSPLSAATTVTIDVTAPAAPSGAPDLQTASDSGDPNVAGSTTDNRTRFTMPVLDVTGTPAGQVTVKEGATSLGTATTDGSGLGSVTTSTLAEGAHTLFSTTHDTAGNESGASPTITVTVDTTAPAAPGAPDLQDASDSNITNDNVTNDTTPAIDVGSLPTDASTVTLLDGTSSVGNAAGGGSSVTITPTLTTQGAHPLTATVTDVANNISASSAPVLTVTIDTVVPSAPAVPALFTADDSGSSPSDGITNVTTPRIFTSGNENPATITLLEGAVTRGTAATDSSGNATITSSTLTDGAHTLVVRQTDLAGNVSGDSPGLTLTIDTIAPATPATAPDLVAASDTGSSNTDNITTDSTPTFTTAGSEGGSQVGMFADGVATGVAATASSGGDATVTTLALADGTRAMTFKATDVAGNTSGASPALNVTIDTVTPAIPAVPDLQALSDSGRLDTDNITSDNTPTFDITGTEAGATVRLLILGVQIGSGTANGSGAVTITASPALADATRDVTAEAKDAAGNVAVLSPALSLTVDTLKPATPSAPDLADASDTGRSISDNITSDTTPTLTVAAEPNAIVAATEGTTPLGTTTTNGGGTGTITTGVLADGTHPIGITAKDVAGNISNASSTLGVLLDTAPPSATITHSNALIGTSKVVFSEDVGSVAGTQLQLRVDGTTSPLGSVVTYAAASKSAFIKPSPPLIPGQRYELALLPTGAPALTDTAGNAVVAAVRDFRASQIEEEFSAGIKQGWRVVGNSNAFGGSYATDHLAGARVTFTFTGTEITWFTLVGPGQGIAYVQIDGRNVGSVNNYASVTQYKTARRFSGLTQAKHTITIIVGGQKGSASGTDTHVAVDAFTVKQSSGATNTQVSPSLGYAWRIVSLSTASGGRYIASDQPGAAFSMVFRGSRVSWFPIVGPQMGRAQVFVDGVSKGTVDLYSPSTTIAQRFFGGLSDGVHTIRIVALGNRNPSSVGNLVTLDRIAVA